MKFLKSLLKIYIIGTVIASDWHGSCSASPSCQVIYHISIKKVIFVLKKYLAEYFFYKLLKSTVQQQSISTLLQNACF